MREGGERSEGVMERGREGRLKREGGRGGERKVVRGGERKVVRGGERKVVREGTSTMYIFADVTGTCIYLHVHACSDDD